MIFQVLSNIYGSHSLLVDNGKEVFAAVRCQENQGLNRVESCALVEARIPVLFAMIEVAFVTYENLQLTCGIDADSTEERCVPMSIGHFKQVRKSRGLILKQRRELTDHLRKILLVIEHRVRKSSPTLLVLDGEIALEFDIDLQIR